DGEPRLGLDGPESFGDEEDVEFRVITACHGKDPVRCGEVYDFRVLEDIDPEAEPSLSWRHHASLPSQISNVHVWSDRPSPSISTSLPNPSASAMKAPSSINSSSVKCCFQRSRC